MPKLSVIVPAREEPYLQKTLNELLRNGGDIEIIVVLDGYHPNPPLKEDKRLVILQKEKSDGLRIAINEGIAMAQGKYLMKIDAHCMISEGYDEIICQDMQDNWVMIPSRYYLDPESWRHFDRRIDYEYYVYPFSYPRSHIGLYANEWLSRGAARQNILLDEDMATLGSCWIVTKEHFDKRLGGLCTPGYGLFFEHHEVVLKTQLGPWDGKLMRNKRIWHAHLKKVGPYKKFYFPTVDERINANHFIFDYWWGNKWEGRGHDFEWLVEKFWPVPDWNLAWKNQVNFDLALA